MKKNTLIIYICLILLYFSVSQSQASDNINKEEFDSFFAYEIRTAHDKKSDVSMEIDGPALEKIIAISSHKDQPEVNQANRLRETIIRERIARDKETLDRTKDLSILKFIFDCKANHFLLTDYPEDEADLDFFQTEECFQDYLGDHWRNDETLKMYWYWYHLQGAMFFLKLSNFMEAEKCLINASEIDAVDVRKKLGSFVASGFQEWNAVNEQNINNKLDIDARNRWFILHQYATLYENVRRSQGVQEFDCIDNITLSILCLFGHDNEKGIEFGLKALGGSWPDHQDPLFRMRSSPKILKLAMAGAYYELKQYDKAVQFYFDVPQSDLTIQCYKNISCMYGSLGLWEQCFKYFIEFQDLSLAQTGTLCSITEEEAILLMKMLMKRSLKDFNTYGKRFIQELKRYVPPLEKDIELLMRYLREKKEAESNKIMRQAIAQQHFEKAKDAYQLFDQQYQKLWAHSSLLPLEERKVYLNSLDKLAHKIERIYSKLMSIKAASTYADNMGGILELSRSLEKSLSLFSSKAKELNHEISKIRRQSYRTTLQGIGPDQERFQEFNPTTIGDSRSIKAQVLIEQKQKESEEKIKEKEVISKKQVRKGNRTHLNQAYEKRSQQEESAKEDNSPLVAVSQSSICSFNDKELQYLWEHQEENLSPNVLEMLRALHEAKSIFQLRTVFKYWDEA